MFAFCVTSNKIYTGRRVVTDICLGKSDKEPS